MFARKCVRLPILVIPFVILMVNFDIYNKSMIVQFIFVHTFRRILTDACTNKSTYEPSPRWIFFSTWVPDGSFYFFTRNWTNYHDLCINQILHMDWIIYIGLGSYRLQKRRAALTELGIDVCCFWPES